MPKVNAQHSRRRAAMALRAAGDALTATGRMLVRIVPRRVRRLAEKIEERRGTRIGHYAAIAFLGAFAAYGFVAGGHLRNMVETGLVAAGLKVEQIEISGHAETAELAILEKLDLDRQRSLLTYSAHSARHRLEQLPWVETAGVRKIYPDRLQVRISERVPFALWQHNKTITVIDRNGVEIVRYTDPRFAVLPLVVGAGANRHAGAFVKTLDSHPSIAERVRAAVFIANRRWNIVFQSSITVKLPEHGYDAALEQLAVLDAVDGILSREITSVDLRLADRVTVRLPDDTAETRKARSAAELQRLRGPGART